MVAMLGKWLTTEAPRQTQIVFPVVGHSFIPPDRVFAQIEKDLKKREVISSPEQYQEIITQYCKLIALDTIAERDWKLAYTPVIKPTTSWHVQFQKCKRFFLTHTKTNNLLLQGEQSYKIDINVKKPITKKNKSITMLNQVVIPANQVIPKKAKITDVSNLLTKHYGEQWRENENFAFNKTVEDRKSNEQGDIEEDTAEVPNDLCEDGFDDVNLIV
ncbi:hypothetical protein HF086_000358 [Spodoptera exigua]|uniref:Uncharacterized protein n=1 Tax=Spodoptera exigua TaxID=7107 RepID=A0A922MAL8_SPOEX|nr:hypothetical protein HF086_000358 [Spodoptera exigua]